MSRSAVFFPTPGARASAAESAGCDRGRYRRGTRDRQQCEARPGADTGDRDEQLEERELVACLEAEELRGIVAHDVMRVQRDRVA